MVGKLEDYLMKQESQLCLSVREAEAFLKAFNEISKSFEDMEAIQNVS